MAREAIHSSGGFEELSVPNGERAGDEGLPELALETNCLDGEPVQFQEMRGLLAFLTAPCRQH